MATTMMMKGRTICTRALRMTVLLLTTAVPYSTPCSSSRSMMEKSLKGGAVTAEV